eukprot:UN16308
MLLLLRFGSRRCALDLHAFLISLHTHSVGY